MHADDVMQDDSDDEDVSSQPLSPYVGMAFDTFEDAQKFYKDYAFKLGFGTHISSTKYNKSEDRSKRMQ